MTKMIDPRYCKHFRLQNVCPNRGSKILSYIDNRVISDMNISVEPEMFDKTFEYCASCAHFAPFAQFEETGQPDQ